MNKILCTGEALIDMICTDRNKPLSEGENFLKKPGGAPTNVAAAIAAMGGSVSLSAKVGVDPFGSHLVDVMKDFGVDTTHMLRDATHFTTFAFVSLMENGERDFYFNRGADAQLNKEDVERISVNEFPIFHFGSATAFLPGPLNSAYRHLLDKAIAQKAFISFDPNYRQLLYHDKKESFIAQSWDFISRCDFFKVSDEEAMLITGMESAEKAALVFSQRTKAVFAITIGKEGTMLGFEGSRNVVPSIPINAIDSTGAGDAFVGLVLFQLAQRNRDAINQLSYQDWHLIISNANKAGARTCEYMGAMEAFKHLSINILDA